MKAYRFSITWAFDFNGASRSTWTAPADLRCGDLLLLYEAGLGGGQKAVVAIGRALTDSIRADKGDKTHWAWVDWQTVKTPLPYADAQRFAKFSVRGPHSEIPVAVFDRLAIELVGGEPELSRTLQRWKDGKDFPRTNEVPVRDLLLASWYAATRDSELDWYKRIGQALRAEGWSALDEPMRAAIRKLRGTLSFDPDGGDRNLRPDLLLMRPNRVLVVEVKLVALPTEGYRNPPDQVLDYARAIKEALASSPEHRRGNWSVDPMLVAGEFSPVVLGAAGAAQLPTGINRIVCREWDKTHLGENLLRA